MQSGRMNSRTTYQFTIDRIFLNVDNVRCLIDDRIIVSNIEREHIVQLKNIFRFSQKHELRLGIKKKLFHETKRKLLGHMINGKGVHDYDSRIGKMKEDTALQTRKELPFFLISFCITDDRYEWAPYKNSALVQSSCRK